MPAAFKYWLGFNLSKGTGEYTPANQHCEVRCCELSGMFGCVQTSGSLSGILPRCMLFSARSAQVSGTCRSSWCKTTRH